jgi:hypothetical protein
MDRQFPKSKHIELIRVPRAKNIRTRRDRNHSEFLRTWIATRLRVAESRSGKSGGGPPQSRTLARLPRLTNGAKRLGVRWQSGSGDTAFERRMGFRF